MLHLLLVTIKVMIMVGKYCEQCGAELSKAGQSGTNSGESADMDGTKIATQQGPQATDFLGQIERLAGLRDTNRLTQAEFEATKKVLLYLLIDVIGQIERLGALVDKGTLTDEEFKTKKTDLLSKI